MQALFLQVYVSWRSKLPSCARRFSCFGCCARCCPSQWWSGTRHQAAPPNTRAASAGLGIPGHSRSCCTTWLTRCSTPAHATAWAQPAHGAPPLAGGSEGIRLWAPKQLVGVASRTVLDNCIPVVRPFRPSLRSRIASEPPRYLRCFFSNHARFFRPDARFVCFPSLPL